MDTLFYVGFALATPLGLWAGWRLADLVREKMSDNKRLPMRTIQEQDEMGGRLRRQTSYVPAMPSQRAQLPATTATSYQIDAHPSAQLGSITHTSASDRANGYLKVQTPLAIILGVLVLAVAKSLADFPLLSFSAFLVFWISFAVVWLAGWGITLLLSAEGVAFYESKRKWDTVQNEQAERWSHYNRQFDEDQPVRMAGSPPKPSRWDDGIDWRAALYATGIIWLFVMSAWVVLR